jgi:hypothetical protein
MKVAGTSPAEGENSVSPEKERILWEISNWLERQLSLSLSRLLRQQWLAVAAVVVAVTVVVAVGCTAEEAAASTAAVWGVAASEVLRLAAGFAVRRLASAALTVATTLPGVAADDLPVAVATGTVEA